MKELEKILDKYYAIKEHTEAVVLATVIHVEGSSYRRPGARMLIESQGNWTSGVSGGCLEGDLLKKSKLVLIDGETRVIRYDTRTDDEDQIGIGLGCQGLIDILLQKVSTAHPNNILEELNTSLGTRKLKVILHHWDKILDWTNDFYPLENTNDKDNFELKSPVKEKLSHDIRSCTENMESGLFHYSLPDNSTLKVFIELIVPKTQVFIFGHEYDVIPLLELLRVLSWRSVLLCSPRKLTRQQHELADDILPLDNLDTLHYRTDRHSAAVLMTHDYTTDRSILRHIINTDLDYIGLLGPRDRGERLVQDLQDSGISIDRIGQHLHYPSGLDIGANEPEEIALSICAEILAVQRHRRGGKLIQRSSPIHKRKAQELPGQ